MIKINDILTGKISVNSSGSAYLVSNDLPKDIYISKNNTNKSLHLDSVKVKVIQGNGRALEGEVIEIIERFRTEFVGIIQVSPRYAFFIPDSNKLPVDFFIPLSKILGAKDGQKVIARLTEWKDEAKNPNAEIIKVLGDAGEHETEINSILEEFGLPYEFPEDVRLEADAISAEITQEEISKRRDLRNVTIVGIDPIDSRDADDTLGIEWIDGECFVSVNIADVSFFVRPDTEIDKEAYARGTSIYLVDRCVAMLPERLSNNICSLKAGSDKLAFSAIFKIDMNGAILDRWFGRTIINVNKDYSYEEAQEVIDNGVREDNKKTDTAIIELNKIAKKLRKDRSKNNFLSLEKQEVRFMLDVNKKPIDVYFKTSGESNKLIEEFMLLANKEVAVFIKSKDFPCVNRIHEKPDEGKLESLKNFVKQFGYIVDFSDANKTKSSLNKLLIESKDSPEGNVISNLITRTQQKAIYSTKDLGHYGLGFKDYSHFTSPIRRESDILTHRLLAMALGNQGYDGDDKIYSKAIPNINKIEAKCSHISEREKKAQKASYASIKYMQCLFMKDKVGKIYKGIVSSVTEYGLFIELIETKTEGLVRLSEIGGDNYTADTSNYLIKGTNTGEVIRLGDEVSVVIASVDVEKKNINLSLIRL